MAAPTDEVGVRTLMGMDPTVRLIQYFRLELGTCSTNLKVRAHGLLEAYAYAAIASC